MDIDIALLRAIVRGYQKAKVPAIQAIIRRSDTPIMVRCPDKMSVAFNEAYLDMWRRTQREAWDLPLSKVFMPDDLHSGLVGAWMGRRARLIACGGGSMMTRGRAGGEEIYTTTHIYPMSGYVLHAFDLIRYGNPEGLLLDQSRVIHPSSSIWHTDRQQPCIDKGQARKCCVIQFPVKDE